MNEFWNKTDCNFFCDGDTVTDMKERHCVDDANNTVDVQSCHGKFGGERKSILKFKSNQYLCFQHFVG